MIKTGAYDRRLGLCHLTIDRHAPRGLKNACGGGAPPGPYPDVHSDAYRALDFLVHQPYVDPQRVVVVGFSQGGMLALSPSSAAR